MFTRGVLDLLFLLEDVMGVFGCFLFCCCSVGWSMDVGRSIDTS